MKVYSSKSNASRAAKKLDVAQVVEVEGGWAVRTPDQVVTEDEVAPKQIEDFDDGSVTGAQAYEAQSVMLATQDEDCGLVPADEAHDRAQQMANDEGTTITVRNPVTDEVLETVEPETPAQETDRLLMQLRVYVPADTAVALAARVAALVGNPVVVHAATSGNQLQVVQPGATKAKAKTAKADGPAKVPGAPRAPKAAPDGMAARIVALCCREQGATPAELNALTQWKGAPWKWLLSNRKGTGLADRYGYDLTVDKDGRAVTYFMTKVEVAKAA